MSAHPRTTLRGLARARFGRQGAAPVAGTNAGEADARGSGANAAAVSGDGRGDPGSYYGLPIINPPVWQSRDIGGYLFLGGLAGASSMLGAAAHVAGRRGLARSSKLAAAGAVGLSFAALVHDLGRPARFLNMLRVFKVTSPMNVGSWLLGAFAPSAAVAAASEVTGLAPRLGTAATAGAAVLGPMVTTYTGALLSNTAVPSWREARELLPYVFAASGASAAAGVGLVAAPAAEAAPARRLAAIAGPAEIGLSWLMVKRMGIESEPYHEGRAGLYTKLADALTAAGALGALAGRRRRAVSFASGAALVAGSALSRFSIFHAGTQSAKDPRYTVVPQRERLRSGE